MTVERHEGGCRCRAVRFEATGSPRLVANCHCKDCRKATGAAHATYVDYPRAQVCFAGAPARYASSPGAERLFCAACGAPIAYLEGASDEINIHIGAFDDPGLFRPTTDAHEESALWRGRT